MVKRKKVVTQYWRLLRTFHG